jgi:hypothetical protein
VEKLYRSFEAEKRKLFKIIFIIRKEEAKKGEQGGKVL